MPCPHNEITIVQRSQRQSAVAAAAYQSGEKLFCEYDQQVKHYPEKRGIVHNEILLPANAPPEYADRNTLWNAAEAVEKQWNSQLARRWETRAVALPDDSGRQSQLLPCRRFPQGNRTVQIFICLSLPYSRDRHMARMYA